MSQEGCLKQSTGKPDDRAKNTRVNIALSKVFLKMTDRYWTVDRLKNFLDQLIVDLSEDLDRTAQDGREGGIVTYARCSSFLLEVGLRRSDFKDLDRLAERYSKQGIALTTGPCDTFFGVTNFKFKFRQG